MTEKQHTISDTADQVHRVIRGIEPTNAVEGGIADAAVILKERGSLDFVDDLHALSFARAVHDVLINIEASGTDMAEGSRDVARSVLAAWSLDQVREEHSGRSMHDDHDRFLRDIGAVDQEIAAVEDGPSILDGRVWAASRDAVLANASLPSEMRDGQAAWEIRLDELVPSDEKRGFERLGGSTGMDMTDVHDVAMDAAIDVMHARRARLDGIVLRDVPGLDDVMASASDARRSFPGRLSPAQEGLVAAEGWMEARLARPLKHEEREMGENALARLTERYDGAGNDARSAARIILLDVSMQMSAARTVRDGTYGEKAHGREQPYDVVLSAAAGVDMFREGVSPQAATTDRIAEGRFHAIPDPDMKASVMQGLADAREPFAKRIENELDMRLTLDRAGRDRAMAVMENGLGGLGRPKSAAKGVEPGAPVLGAYLAGDRGR